MHAQDASSGSESEDENIDDAIDDVVDEDEEDEDEDDSDDGAFKSRALVNVRGGQAFANINHTYGSVTARDVMTGNLGRSLPPEDDEPWHRRPAKTDDPFMPGCKAASLAELVRARPICFARTCQPI